MLIRSKLGHTKCIFPLSLGAFLVFLGAFVVCSNVDFSESVEATDVSSKFTVSLNDVLTISSPSSIILDNCNPSTASLCTASATVNVSTNNLTGYSLYLNATSGSSNSLTNTAVTPNPTIPTLSQSYSSANFPVNSWGYTGGTDQSGNSGYNCSTNYCPILDYEADPEDYSPNHLIKETSAPAATSNTNLTFAAKADTSKASGTYTTSVTFTAVGNEVPANLNGMDMQDIDSSVCDSVTSVDTTFTVIDSRDNKEYTVAKLQDGNCWMTQNLELGQYGTSMNLTDDTSNVSPSGYTLTFNYANASTYKGNSNKYGNYYTWAQATAGSGSSIDVTYEDAPYDICPKGWRLPSAGVAETTGNEFYTMLNNYINSGVWENGYWDDVVVSDFTDPPVSLVFSGVMSSTDGNLYRQGENGNFLSSTFTGSFNTGVYLYTAYTRGDVSPMYIDYSDYARSVRCLVSKPKIKNGMYMQDVTQEQISNTPTDAPHTLKDARDEKEYTVAKLQDGNLWMTQNLALGGSSAMTLTSANTDIASNFTLPASVSEGSWAESTTVPEFFDYAGNYDDSSTKYGNYYNWPAATAGSGGNTDGVDAQYSICPKNWRLPSAGNTGYIGSEQYIMIDNYITTGTWDDSNYGYEYWYDVSTSEFASAPVSLALSGSYQDRILSGQGEGGYWWSSTPRDNDLAYHLSVGNDGNVFTLYPHTDYYKFYGYSIRCLAPGA